MAVEMGEISAKDTVRPIITDAKGILKQNRKFLDFFWEIAKPEQAIRVKAIESLVKYLKNSEKEDELDYTIMRLVDGLAHTREVARPGFSLALAQVLQTFEQLSLQNVFSRIKTKHNLQTAKKKFFRNAVFGNYFGVLAISQSTRLVKEPQVMLECVQLLQRLSQHREHVKDLPSKTMAEILSEVPEEVFNEVLLGTLQSDLSSAFSTPEQLQLLLVAMERFPKSLKPKKLNKLLGTTTIITAESIPKLTRVLKMAANSMKKECVLPSVALDLLKLSLREGSFQLFWSKAIVDGMFQDPSGPTHYLSYRLLGSALPFLSLDQLKAVLSGDVMLHYGDHVISTQKPDRFKLAPEMDVYVSTFLQGCEDPDRQLAVMTGFSSLTNRGCPVVPSVWRVLQHLLPAALRGYVAWLKTTFLHPRPESCLDFSTRRQKSNQKENKKQEKAEKEECVFRLRKWTVARLASIIEDHSVKQQEDLVKDVARFLFFHAFFTTKKATPDIPESKEKLSVPLDERTRDLLAGSFFRLLQCMHRLPVLGDAADALAAVTPNQRRVLGVTADGTLWMYCMVQYADMLLGQSKHVQSAHAFEPKERQAWDSMLVSVAALMKKGKKRTSAENNAFQQLFLSAGIYFFKSPVELVDTMTDLQSCIKKAQEKKAKKTKKSIANGEEEPQWVEVVVDILLSLLSQPSRHIRQVCRMVFASICPHVTAAALNSILDVLDPDQDDEEGAVMVTDDKDPGADAGLRKADELEDEAMLEAEEESDLSDDDSDGSDDDDDDDDDDEEEEAMEEDPAGDQNFRLELMKVLQKQDALATEEDGSDVEDLDDKAMMKLDKRLSELFSEQKKKVQDKKDEKAKLQKQKTLVLDFKLKVLDLVEVFVIKQGGSPLVLGMVEPLLNVIERSLSSDNNQQEQDFLRRVADIFKNQLCRSKVYCRTVADRQGELHDLLEKIMAKARKADSSVSLYHFSASLYIVKVLKGSAPGSVAEGDDTANKPVQEDLRFMGSVDVERVSTLFREALHVFMSKRNCPLTVQMFMDLFSRFPVLCVSLLDTAVQSITDGVREHQQTQACVLVLQGLQSREVQQLMAGAPWTELCRKVVEQLTASLKQLASSESKVAPEKSMKVLGLCKYLVRHIQQQKLTVDLEALEKVLKSFTEAITFKKTLQLWDSYWVIMKLFGVVKPRVDKAAKAAMKAAKKEAKEADLEMTPGKKKGFLPETKKRKNRKQQAPVEGPAEVPPSADKAAKKKKQKRKQPAEAEGPSHAIPAKKAKTQTKDTPPTKKKMKKKMKKKKPKTQAEGNA